MVSWLLGVMSVWSVVCKRRAFATGIKGHDEQFRCNGFQLLRIHDVVVLRYRLAKLQNERLKMNKVTYIT